MDCSVCCEKLNKSNHKNIICNYCEFSACKTCIQKYLIENDYFDATSTSYKLNILVRPNELNMQLLPNSYKAIVEEKIKKHQNWLNDVVKNSYLASGWDQVISYMYSEDKSHMFPKFLEFNKKLDDRRGQNMFDAFPELKDLPSLYTG